MISTVRLTAQDPGPLAPFHPPSNNTQTLRIWGNRHMAGLAHEWAKGFQTLHPGIAFDIKLLGNGTGMSALYTGVADLALFGRDTIVTDNDGFAHVLNYKPLRIELGTGSLDAPGKSSALVIFVHRDNPIVRLTLSQLDAVFGCERRRGAPSVLRTWGDLGLTGEWANQPIHLYGDDTQSASGLFFQHAVLNDSRKMNWECFTEFKDIKQSDGTVLVAAQQSAGALQMDRYGLAVSNLHFASPGVKVVALAANQGETFLIPTKETLIARNYPLARAIFACANQPPGQQLDPKVQEFLRYILSSAGQQDIEREGSYLPLSAVGIREQLAKLP
ncbi:MAG TPA: substrate-binding domain-containing protein [Opitutaceae bacterium]|nr:substrate-binding domain-containing protein [Opitutaceae bacterium]